MRRAAVAMATLAVVAGVLTVSPAQAGPTASACTTTIDKGSIKITPKPVVVPARYWARQVVTFRVQDSCLSGSATVAASVDYQTEDSEIGGATAAATSENGHWFRARIEVYLGAERIDNKDAGWWHPDIWVTGSETDEALPPLFYVLRETQLTANATPEPVKKNHTVTVTGRLTRADLDAGRNRAYGHQKVALQFRTKTGSYRTVKTVTSGAKGALTATVKATRSGYYRYAFTGNGTTSASVNSAADFVRVK